jgi:uncharacterized protein (TIGR03435 family)
MIARLEAGGNFVNNGTAVLWALALGVAFGQAQAQAPSKFDVISIKPGTGCGESGRNGSGGGRNWSPGRLKLECRTVMSLVRMAYAQFANGQRRAPGSEVPIEGGPSWINSIAYTIEAKADGSPGLEMMSGPMMQALLEDRFKLRVRRNTQAVPVYELVHFCN